MKIKVALIVVVLLLAASSLGMAVETWTSGWTQNKVTATIHYVDISGKKISRNFIGTYNDFEIDRDDKNHHYIWLYSTNEFGNHSGMQITVNAVGSGLSNPSGATTFLATNGDPNLNKFANSTSSFPLTLQLTPSIYMDPSDVKSLLIKGAYTINNLVGSSSPILHLYATGILTVYGNRYPGFITLSAGQRNLPPAPLGNYSVISSNMTPKQPAALNSGTVVAKDLPYSISFGNNTTFNIIKDSGANASGSTTGLQVTLIGNPLDGTGTLVSANQQVNYKSNLGFSGVDDMYYVVSTNPNTVSPKYQIKVTVGPAPVAHNAAPKGMTSPDITDPKLMVEKNSTNNTPFDLGSYVANWSHWASYEIPTGQGPFHGRLQGKSSSIPSSYLDSYTPNPGFNGIDYFTYYLETKNVWTSAPGTVAVWVLPIAFDDQTTVYTGNKTFNLNLLANDETYPGATATIFHVYSSAKSELSITPIKTAFGNISSVSITTVFTAAEFTNSTSTDTFAYTMEDSYGQTSTASVTIHLLP